MDNLKQYGIPVLIMAVVTMVLGAVAIGVLYDTAFEVERRRLTEIAQSRASLIEAVARFDQIYSGNYPDGEKAATVSQVIDAHERYQGFGETGEFVLARRQDEQIFFILRRRHGDRKNTKPVPFGSPLAEPMRRALSGHSGTVVGLDYRGVSVLAAHEPVSVLDMGIVAKIDLAEIRAPFIKAGLIVAGLGLLILTVGTALFVAASKAGSQRLRDSEERYRALSDLTGEGVAIHENGIIVEVNQAYAKMYGYDLPELIGKAVLDFTVPEESQTAAERVARNVSDTYESESFRKDGSQIPVEIKSAPVVYQGRKMRVSRLRDLTEARRAAAAIRDSEQLFKNITDNLPVLIAYIDRDERYRSANKLFESWYQKPLSEIIGRQMNETLLPESYAELKNSIDRALAGEAVMREDEAKIPDGVYRYRRLHYLPDVAEDGQVMGFYALVEDISDIRRATRELERQGASLEEAQRIGNMGNWERDFTTGTLHWSAQLYRIFGQSNLTSDGPNRQGFMALVHEDDRHFVQAGLDAAAEGDAPYSLDHRIVLTDGTVRVVHEEAVVIRDEAGRVLRMAGTTQDITEHKQTEQALRDSEQQLRMVTDALPLVISYIDAEERYQFVNLLAVKWFGKPIPDIIGNSLANNLGPETYAKLQPFIVEVLSGRERHFDTTVIYPDGRSREMEVTYLPRMGPGEEVLGFYSLAIDVTERHALEARLRQSQKMEAIGQLTGGVAHEFNNLLQVVMGNLELLTGNLPVDDQNTQWARTIQRNVERGSDLTSQLLSFSRQAPLAPKAIEIGAMLAETQAMWLPVLGETIEIKTDVPDDPWMVEVDPGQLASGLLNLALNARDAMPDGGTITIAAKNVRLDAAAAERHEVLPGEFVVLSVADTGEGMSEDALSHAFDPFFTTKDVGKGTGLGLSMVHGFIHQSGGFAEIKSEWGHGTTVHLFLPRHGAPLAEAVEADAKDNAAASGEGVILLVEDDADVRESLAMQLAKMDCRVIEAKDGIDALAILDSGQKIDLLFTDIVMPGGISGLDLAQMARKIQSGLKVVYTTGYADDIVAKAGQMEDNAILLRKPYDGKKLRQTIIQALPGKDAVP